MESPDPISQFSGRRYIILESYKKNGEPKLTPLESFEHDGLLYMRTGPKTWKVRRIRRNPHVCVVPCNQRGMPVGTWVEAEARIVEGEELEQAKALFKEEYGAIGNRLRRIAYRLFRGQSLTTVITISLQRRN